MDDLTGSPVFSTRSLSLARIKSYGGKAELYRNEKCGARFFAELSRFGHQMLVCNGELTVGE